MAKDMKDVVRDTVNELVRDAAKNLGVDGKRKFPIGRKSSSGPLSGAGGVAAGAGLAALAPIAAKRAGQAAKRRLVTGAAKDAAPGGEKRAAAQGKGAAKTAGGVVGDATSKLGDAVRKLPSTGSEGGGEQAPPGVGTGRRMPVQQAMDVAVPIETCYNQWTQFEDWPSFMHRVTRVTQEDPCSVSFTTKIWGKSKQFTAEIETERPDERIKWRVADGIMHTGVVTFHELAPRLTRVELTVDVDPGSLLEKAARGMRHIKRGMRADLHRFKAYIEMQEIETGAWRGVIEDGELVDDHDASYDEERDYRVVAVEHTHEADEEPDEEPEEEPAPQPARGAESSRQMAPAGGGGS